MLYKTHTLRTAMYVGINSSKDLKESDQSVQFQRTKCFLKNEATKVKRVNNTK